MSETVELRALLTEVRELLVAGVDLEVRARATAARRLVEICAEVEADRPSVVLVAMPFGGLDVELDLDSVRQRIQNVRRLNDPSVRSEPGGLSVELYEVDGYAPTAGLTHNGCLDFHTPLEVGRQLQLAAEDFCHLCRVLAAEVESEYHVLVLGRLLSAKGLELGGVGHEVRRSGQIRRRTVRMPDHVNLLRDDAIDALHDGLLTDFARMHSVSTPASGADSPVSSLPV